MRQALKPLVFIFLAVFANIWNTKGTSRSEISKNFCNLKFVSCDNPNWPAKVQISVEFVEIQIQIHKKTYMTEKKLHLERMWTSQELGNQAAV